MSGDEDGHGAAPAIRLLCIEENPADTLRIEHELEAARFRAVQVTTASQLDEGLKLIREQPFDVALLDVDLSDSRSFEIIERYRREAPALPAIVLSNFCNEEITEKVLHSGIQDCIAKKRGFGQALARSLRFAAELHRLNAELRQRLQTIAADEARMRRIIDASSDAMFIVDEHGMVRLVNPAAERMFDRPAGDLIGAPFGFAAVGGQETELDIVRQNGKTGVAEMRVVEMTWEHPNAYLAVLRDISERKKFEEQILQLNSSLDRRVRERTRELEVANRELEAFSYSVSHDLRTPLHGIEGLIRMLRDQHSEQLDAEGRNLLELTIGEAKRMDELINVLLEFSRTAGKTLYPYEIDMRELAETAFYEVMSAAPERKVDFEIGDLPHVTGEPEMLRQVWVNLLGNAVKFTARRDDARIEVGATQSAEEIVFHVRDNGVGFDMGAAHKLFTVFQRLHGDREFKGTGVGLAFAQRIVQRHGGRIWGEGAIGRGATFCFALPTDSRATAPVA